MNKKLSKALGVRYEDLAGDIFDSGFEHDEFENIIDRLKRLPEQDRNGETLCRQYINWL